mmetsp:Transcript_64049/g.119021  ORF Transcript_64049/g.119021 Transcript_64049/m.119021 type:complete len:82 (-) Transcript_64049:1880-2125(-)
MTVATCGNQTNQLLRKGSQWLAERPFGSGETLALPHAVLTSKWTVMIPSLNLPFHTPLLQLTALLRQFFCGQLSVAPSIEG